MTAAEREYLPEVECAPWCDQGDGHPMQYFSSDQSCWEPAEYVELSLEEPAEVDYPQRVGVMARRRPNQDGHVLVHLDGMKVPGPNPFPYNAPAQDNALDHEVMFTADEAERLGRRLIASARLARLNSP